MLRRKGLSLAAIGAVLGAAMLAATMPASAGEAIKWSGAYIGAHAGYGWADWNGVPVYDAGHGPVAGVFGDDQRDISADGWLGGAQIGFNRQTGSLVLGIEVDGSWGQIEGEKAFVTTSGSYLWDVATRLEAMGTARGRVGVLAGPSLLLYGTAGLAFGRTSGDLTVTSKDFDPAKVTAVGDASENHIGWAAGGGAEWKINQHWSMKAEYMYVDLGSASYRLTGTAYPDKAPCEGAISASCSHAHTTDSFPADLTLHTVRVGVNYQFSN